MPPRDRAPDARARLAEREGARRNPSQTGEPSLSLVRTDGTNTSPAPSIPDFSVLADEQVEGARSLLTRDLSSAPRWAWRELDALAGPMLPGDLIVVGAYMGNGKSSLLMTQMDDFAAKQVPVLYVPLEVDPAVCRLRWAGWKLSLDVRHVIRQDWASLPEGSREAVDGILEEQTENQYIHFAAPKRMTAPALFEWCVRAVNEVGVQVVMLDHFHRLSFGSGQSWRTDITEVARQLKDRARELNITMLAAAQLNRAGHDPVDQYKAPDLSRIKESSAIGEEADVVMMLSRKLRSDLPKGWMQDLKLGRRSEVDLAEPNTMVVTCRKHRLDGSALGRSVQLVVENGKLRSRRQWTQGAIDGL